MAGLIATVNVKFTDEEQEILVRSCELYKSENAKLREQAERLFDKTLELATENAKLREERNHWKVEQTHAYSNWEDAHKRVTELEDENAKLRELCGELAGELHALGVDFNRIGWCFLRDELRELGIEVSG